MALNFPDSPFVGQIYSDVTAGFSYVWDGTVWKSYYQSDQTPDGTVTPPKLSPGGPVWNTSGDLNVTGILTAANISVAGTITYEDVTSVDSIGVVTARSGVVVVGGGVSVAGGGIDVNGHTETDTLRVSGVSTFQNSVYVTGQNRLYFGSSDLGIFYQTLPSASNYIAGFNNVPLTIWADNLTLGAQNGENFATFTTNGSASLYYDNSKKFETLGTGVTITGTTFTNQLNVSGVSTFTNSINLNAGNLKVATDGIIKIGNSDQLELYYNGSTGQTIKSTGDLRILTNRLLLNNSANDEQLIEANQNGSVALYYDNSKKFETTNEGAVVTGILTATTVGIGTTNPTTALQLNTSGTDGIKLVSTSGVDITTSNILSVPGDGSLYFNTDSTGSWNGYENILFNVAGTDLLKLTKDNGSNWSVLVGGTSYSFQGLDVNGNIGINGQTIFDTNRRVTRTLQPSANNTYDLGSSTFAWKSGYFTDNVFIGSGTSTGTANQNLQVTGGGYFSSNVGIGTTNPTEKLAVRGGDISVGVSTAHGLVLTSPNGTQYRLIIDDSGNLSTTAV